jgi:hypothetical protein
LREVLGQGRGDRVPVSIAGPHAGGRGLTIVPGQLGQLPQRGGVAIQRDPAVAGEGDGGLRVVTGGLSRSHVPGAAQLAQAGDQAAGRQPDHVLQPPDGERVAVRQGRQGRDDAQPRRVVDQRVQYAGTHSRSRLPMVVPSDYRPPSRSRSAWV